jgi:hypothetical protein
MKIKNTVFQNLWDAAKVVLRGNFTVINADSKKENKQPRNIHQGTLIKETKHKVSRRK